EVRTFALRELIEDAIELVAPRAQDKGIELGCFIDPHVPATVTGDPARLRQVLLNLLGNAVKFTERGGVTIIAEPASELDHVNIAVHDTGIGIAPADQPRIFREFEQADGSSTRQFGGTGLGLAISKRIVERMGGSISLDSEPGVGSTFSFSVPLPTASDAAPVPTPDFTGRSILIVTTAATSASLLARQLTAWGASIAIASDEQHAVEKLAAQPWDAMLVDHALATQMSAICQLASVNAKRRIVLMTPAKRIHLASLRDAGFDGYLIKPVRAVSLAARLDGAESEHTLLEDAPPLAPDNPERAATRLSVLVAEDNEINALLARALLTRLGHDATIATNGKAAVAAWRDANDAGRPFDLVLMDLQMPGIDGLEATRRIRALEPEGFSTPIFALTANAFAEGREAALAAGMDGFLVKPLEREPLTSVIASVFRHKSIPLVA
ncbi:MAG: response regulator, partial [Pseudolabrys sp.]|nr:response regulator [Pseudolabrys sp.]